MPAPKPPAPAPVLSPADDLAARARRLLSGRSAPKAGRALGELGPDALPALRGALAHANPFVRSGALHGLEAAASHGADVTSLVADALATDADPRVQETACKVLGRLGAPAVEQARAALERAVQSADERVRLAATACLAPGPR